MPWSRTTPGDRAPLDRRPCGVASSRKLVLRCCREFAGHGAWRDIVDLAGTEHRHLVDHMDDGGNGEFGCAPGLRLLLHGAAIGVLLGREEHDAFALALVGDG